MCHEISFRVSANWEDWRIPVYLSCECPASPLQYCANEEDVFPSKDLYWEIAVTEGHGLYGLKL